MRPTASAGATTTPPIASVASAGVQNTSVVPAVEVGAVAAAAAMENVELTHPLADPEQQAFNVDAPSWWSPGMQVNSAADSELYEGTYAYGNEDFY